MKKVSLAKTLSLYLCSVGRSTKKGNRSSGYIGEKGIGFLSVFLVTDQPYVFSNRYQIRFNERPCPTTTIVLPLKPDKVNPVKHQLSSIHPEVLLFLSKIRHLSVREDNDDPKKNSVTTVSISIEVNFLTEKNVNAESYTIHLSAGENSNDEEVCSYYMWKQKFPVKLENVVERRMGLEDCVVTLAFPHHERLHKDKSLPGVYAFLPTEMVTNFPFIIQADFILASSRETILLDDKWNQGILEYVPSAFIDAFKTLATGSTDAPICSLPYMLKFIPIHRSPFENLNHVREKIKAQQEGVYLLDLSSHDGVKILSSSFDKREYDDALKFLGVKQVKIDWYARCIQISNLVDGVSEDIYLEILHFVAKNWSRFNGSNICNIPLIKYVVSDGIPSFFTLHECILKGVFLADTSQTCPCSWLFNWNNVFTFATKLCFMPESTQQAIAHFPYEKDLMDWLAIDFNVHTFNVYNFNAHFLYHSLSNGYLSSHEVDALCNSMPLVDNYGRTTVSRNGVLLPANVSKWADLIVSNTWRNENYVELGKAYLNPTSYAGQHTDSGELINFLKNHVKASDIPFINPPNAGFSAADTPLTKDNAFLLLDWIRKMNRRGVDMPERFLECIKGGRWLKVAGNRYMSPSKSFLIGSKLGKLLQSGSVLVDIPLVDESFFGKRINKYIEELKIVGVMFSYEEACKFIGRELMSRAASFSLSNNHVLLILNFIQYLRTSLLPLNEFVDSIKEGSWLKTSHGFRSHVGSVLSGKGWKVASQISDIPFIDHAYFAEAVLLIMECIKCSNVPTGVLNSIKEVPKKMHFLMESKNLQIEHEDDEFLRSAFASG
ncbi:ATP/DNA binding protein [Trifolium repens]|nr:ATP/DNA binding protein [Trifolium repens]